MTASLVRGTGWVPEPPPSFLQRAASRARGARAVIGGAIGRVGAAMIDRSPWILDQGLSESCTGHFLAQAIYGLSGVRCSPYLPWYWARVRQLGLENVVNMGVGMTALVTSIADHGACTYEHWNPSVTGFDMNGRPNALARIEAQRHKLNVVPIWETGSTALELVMEALVRRQPCGIVVRTDSGFIQPGPGGVVGPPSGPSRGLHIVPAWGYRTLGNGRVQPRIVNSWGFGWGEGGCGWLDESRVREAPFLCVARSVFSVPKAA